MTAENDTRVPALHIAAKGLGRVRHGLRRALDVVLPPLCIACRVPVSDHGALCPQCWAQVTFIRPPVCDRLGTPLPYALGQGALSAEAIDNPPAFDHARGALLFDGVGQQLIHGLKYADRLTLAPVLARWMVHAGEDVLTGADLLLPVPLHWTRLFRRRFNQAAELARHIHLATGIAWSSDSLLRQKATPHQTGLNRDDRHENVADAFVVREGDERIAGAHVVLVDDVLTTGATADACARVLRRAGARRVDVLVAARVVDYIGASHI